MAETMTAVERVARAICQADEQNGGPPWDLRVQNKHSREHLFDQARAALAALHGCGLRPYEEGHSPLQEAWRAGIDFALAESE